MSETKTNPFASVKAALDFHDEAMREMYAIGSSDDPEEPGMLSMLVVVVEGASHHLVLQGVTISDNEHWHAVASMAKDRVANGAPIRLAVLFSEGWVTRHNEDRKEALVCYAMDDTGHFDGIAIPILRTAAGEAALDATEPITTHADMDRLAILFQN